MEGPEGFLLCQIVMDAPTKQFNCGNDKMFRTRMVDCKIWQFLTCQCFFHFVRKLQKSPNEPGYDADRGKNHRCPLGKVFRSNRIGGLVNLQWFDSKACGTSSPQLFQILFSGFSGCQGRQYFFCPKMRVIAALIFCVGLWQMAFVGRLGSSYCVCQLEWSKKSIFFSNGFVVLVWTQLLTIYMYIFLSLCYVVLKCGNNPLFVLASLVDAEPLMLHTTPGCFAKKKGAHKILLVKALTQIGL